MILIVGVWVEVEGGLDAICLIINHKPLDLLSVNVANVVSRTPQWVGGWRCNLFD